MCVGKGDGEGYVGARVAVHACAKTGHSWEIVTLFRGVFADLAEFTPE